MSKKVLFAVACALFAAGTASAQTTRPPASQPPMGGGGESRSVNSPQMYEDIEVFRRLLDRSLLSLPGVWSSPAATVAADRTVRFWDPTSGKELARVQGHGPAEVRLSEGVYLKDHGIVYSVLLPLHFQDAITQPGKPAPKALSDWERTRKELQGQQVEPVEKERERREASVADAVLKVLAENGRHLTHLGDNEQLTVAITLRATSLACTQCHAASGKAPAGAGAMGSGGMGSMMGLNRAAGQAGMRPVGQPRGQFGTASDTSTAADDSTPKPLAPQQQHEGETDVATRKAEGRKQVLVGDLHMKQGQARSAGEAYERALNAYLSADLPRRQQQQRSAAGQVGKDIQTELEVVEAATKLAQACLALNENDRAENVLTAIARYAQGAGQAAPAARADEGKPRILLPAKLILSATKQQLDQVGSGKISFEEFKKGASVQYLTFPAAAKEPKGNPPSGGNTP